MPRHKPIALIRWEQHSIERTLRDANHVLMIANGKSPAAGSLTGNADEPSFMTDCRGHRAVKPLVGTANHPSGGQPLRHNACADEMRDLYNIDGVHERHLLAFAAWNYRWRSSRRTRGPRMLLLALHALALQKRS